jgi:hypothetical protein
MKMEMEKVRHDWNIQREDKIAQSENTKEWVGTIKDIIEHSVKPTLGEFAKGYGEAMARQKYEAEMQKAAAMQEQQMIQQQRARAAAMNRQRMGGGVPPQQQQQPQRPRPPQQVIQQQPQQQQFYQEPQEQQPSRAQQEMQKNMVNEEKVAAMSMEEIDQVEEEILQGISMARPLYIRLEQEKKKRLSQIGANRQAQQAQESPAPQQEAGGKESKPESQGKEGMDFGVSVGSE